MIRDGDARTAAGVTAKAGSRPEKVEVLSRRRLLDDFLVVEEARLRHERFDGTMTGDVRRLRLVRGDAAAALPYDPARRCFYLTEQFRWPVHSVGVPGWFLEIPAGIVSPGEVPASCMLRELREETGLEPRKWEHAFTYFASPGGSTERIFLYVAEVDGTGASGRVGGEAAENEDIRVVAVPYANVDEMLAQGRICDGKTIIALLAFRERQAQRALDA
jgi:ADP-ribose pyrophosphatase